MTNPHICAHCTNAYRERCVTDCAPTGNYCAFQPRPLGEWEPQPAFPLTDFLQMTAREARVLMGLYLFWHGQTTHTGRPACRQTRQTTDGLVHLASRL